MNPPTTIMPPDETRGPAMNAITWTCVGIATLFTGLRVLTRARITRNLGWGDAIIVFSWVLFVISVALTTACVSHGLGRHIQYLTPVELEQILHTAVIFQAMGIFPLVFPKFAVVMLIISLMGTKKRGIWFLYSLLAVLLVSNTIACIFIFAQCDPPSRFWHVFSITGTCWSPNVLKYTTIFAASWSAFSDGCLSIFPITVFWNLQMDMGRKIGLSIIMGLGIFAMICGIIKTTFLPDNENPDVTWVIYPVVCWTYVESTVIIVCACAPTLPQLVLLVMGKRKKPTYNYPSQPSKPSYLVGDKTTSNSSYNQILDEHSNRKESNAEAVELRDINMSAL